MLFIIIVLLIFAIAISFICSAYLLSEINKVKFFNKKRDINNKIYLTFDDGPSEYTSDLLDLLREYNIKASFFCVAKFVEKNPEIVKRMKREGHLICLHSFEHKNALLYEYRYTKKDFENSYQIMKKYINKEIFYRPPWGHINIFSKHFIKKYDFKFILWNVMVGDWRKNITSQEIAKRLLEKTKGSDIVCLHDGRGQVEAPKRTIEALKIVLPIWVNEKKYDFETVEIYGKK